MSDILNTIIEQFGVLGVILAGLIYIIYDIYKTVKNRLLIKSASNSPEPISPAKKPKVLDTLVKFRHTIKYILKTHIEHTHIDHALLFTCSKEEIVTITEYFDRDSIASKDNDDKLRFKEVNKEKPADFKDLYKYVMQFNHASFYIKGKESIVNEDVLSLVELSPRAYSLFSSWKTVSIYIDIIPQRHSGTPEDCAFLLGYAFKSPSDYDIKSAMDTINLIENILVEDR